jgi:hypothetical protein
MPMKTLAQLQATNRRLDHFRHRLDEALAAMKQGAILQQFQNGFPLWRLSTGAAISAAVAKVITNSPDVTGAGDGLFGTSQTFYYRPNHHHGEEQ